MDIVLTLFGELDTKHQMKIFADAQLRSRILECGNDREKLDRLWGKELRALDPEAGVLDEKYFACYYRGRVYVWLGRVHPFVALLSGCFVALEFAHPERRDPEFQSQHPLVQEGAALLPALRGVEIDDPREVFPAVASFAEKVFATFDNVMTLEGGIIAHKAFLLQEYLSENGADADAETLYRCVVSICETLAETN